MGPLSDHHSIWIKGALFHELVRAEIVDVSVTTGRGSRWNVRRLTGRRL